MKKREFDALKKRAKEKLQGNTRLRNLDGKVLTREEINDAFHDLQVYQVELEIQNEELINAQQQLMEMSERYRNLYENAPVGYLTISSDGLIKQCNETFLQLLGLTPIEVIDRSVRNWISQKESITYYSHRKQLITTGQQQVFKLHLHRKNRTEIYAKVTLKLNVNSGDKQIFMIVQDETEMLDIQEGYENLVENSAQGLWLFQEEQLVYANNRACEIIGCEPQMFVGKTVNDLLTFVDDDHWQQFAGIFEVAAGKKHIIKPVTIKFKKNESSSPIWLEFFISNSRFRGNDALQLAFTDVTDKVVADEKIRKSEHLFKTSSNLASDSIYTITLPEKTLHLLSSGVQYKKYTYDFSTMDLNTFFEAIDSEFREKIIRKHEELMNDGKYLEETYAMHLPIGENIFIHDRATVLEWENNKPKTIIGVTTDMTQIIEKEKQLTALNATKDKFFSIIAHDLKNPFNALIGFTDLLTEDYENMADDERQSIIRILAKTAGSGFKLLENLLNWSRLQTNRIEYNPAQTNLHDLVANMVDFMKVSANQKQIALSNKIQPDIVVHADNNIVETILRNLISNAIKFTPAQGWVTISANAGQDEETLTVKVADSGRGMEKEIIDTVFNIENIDSTPGTAGERGTGLGLILCRDFVKMEGGKIWLESEMNKGTSEYFTLKMHATGQ
jgi:PAS domain S-box-containing protein